MCNIKWLWKSQTALKGQTSNTNGSKNQPKKLELKTMKGLDTVESLSAGTARDPNRNMGTVIILLMRTNLVKLLLVL